uniref:Protein YIF1 n=1 Tax=Latimeria chalumnae TaxID=7897 RepID=H3B4I6_LATCH
SLHYYVLGSKHRARGSAPQMGDPNQLFDDTSTSYPPQPGGYASPGIDMGFNMNNIFADPMANVAMAYGSTIANQGKDIVNKELFVLKGFLKIWFFRSTLKVLVALEVALLDFSVVHTNWEVRYHRDLPLTPRQDVNAPDLYIPTMAFITYVLLAGTALGIQKRFSPEVLGICASTALVWMVIEVLALLLGLYLVTIQSDLTTFDLVAYCGYKYVGMILTVLSGLVFGNDGYHVTLAWMSCALMYFIVRSLRMKILSTLTADGVVGHNTKNRMRMYITVAVAGFQPLIIYWLTSH